MTIRIGTSERDGTFHSQGRALKILFERRPALAAVEVLASNSASMENALRLDAGEIELGFMASNWIGRAKNGEAPFARPQARLSSYRAERDRCGFRPRRRRAGNARYSCRTA